MGNPDDHDPEPEFDLFEKTDEQGEPEFDLFEKSEHEPEEYDPEAELYDSSTDSLTVPEVSTGEMDVPAEIQKTFWSMVVVLNIAIFLLALGPMLIVFEGQRENGALLIAGGVVLCGFAFRRYRNFQRKKENGELSTSSASVDGDETDEESADEMDENPTGNE